MSENKKEEKKKKHGGLLKIIFKLITLGGILVVIYKALQKNRGQGDKE